MGSPLVRFDSNGSIIDKSDAKAEKVIEAMIAQNAISAPSSVIAAEADTRLTGSLSGTETEDLIAVELVAGQTYSFAYRGTVEGGIEDPYLALFGPGEVYITEDDDGGAGRTSQITYTATVTGTHYLYATSWYTLEYGDPSLDTGNYTIDIWEQDPAKDAPDTFEGAEVLTVGETTFGYLDSATDIDVYQITAEAGKVYSFTYAGGIAGAAELGDPFPGENIGYVSIYDSEGNLVADGLNYETGASFFAETGGTYYVQVEPYDPSLLGGYTLDVSEIDPSDLDPLDSIDWVNAANVPFVDVGGVPTAYVYFAPAGENFGELGDDGNPMITYGWQQFQIDGVMKALGEFEEILGVNYVITTDASQATFRLLTTESEEYGAYFYPRDPSYGTQQGIAAFNLLSGGFTLPASLQPGGYSYGVILHEFGHAHGLAHPHDEGGGSDIMLGVTGPDSLGVYDLNQGVYTVMSYNDGWATHPSGPLPFSRANIGYGWSGSLSAFDIAQLQTRYGVHAQNTGNTLYRLDDANVAGTFFETIWDTGGTDIIRYDGARDAHIDLLAATLDYSPTGGGVVSYVDTIYGGYTIANSVVIENATGGSGDDTILGNDVRNVLIGNAGNDTLIGRAGDDILYGYAGDDVLQGGDGNDTLRGGLGNDTLDGGDGNDSLLGEGGDNILIGGAGRDTIYGAGGADTIDGGDGADSLRGGADNDVIEGGAGDDTILGEAGDDIITGGAGRDTLLGGAGADTFVFEDVTDSAPAFRDVIRDFAKGSDLIDLSAIDSGAAGGAFSLVSAFSGTAGELVVTNVGAFQQIRGDVNGDSIADFAILVTVTGGQLAAADFVL
ncbi:Ca2+-binding RTX toxin-like protein [Sphingomonas zeicaulis]|uniref:M10 family metallopeptidase C-terminal domain-containing protein n=1 Tax=Sphingomonas zeicaulis TaxID=1632740 RepID=UPI003D1A66BC